jgi:hypothetical protein
MMIETLYRTNSPDTALITDHVFELTLGEETVDNQLGYYVRETHCWWDPRTRQIIRVQYTLSPRGGFATLDEAQASYDLQKTNRARRGYMHSFAPRYTADRRHNYVRVEVPGKASTDTKAEPSDAAL